MLQSFFGAIDSLEKKVADVRVRCSDQVEAALDRVAQMEGSHQQDLVVPFFFFAL